jgi:hypothetical protein
MTTNKDCHSGKFTRIRYNAATKLAHKNRVPENPTNLAINKKLRANGSARLAHNVGQLVASGVTGFAAKTIV